MQETCIGMKVSENMLRFQDLHSNRLWVKLLALQRRCWPQTARRELGGGGGVYDPNTNITARKFMA